MWGGLGDEAPKTNFAKLAPLESSFDRGPVEALSPWRRPLSRIGRIGTSGEAQMERESEGTRWPDPDRGGQAGRSASRAAPVASTVDREERRSRLSSVIADEIVPRLLRIHREIRRAEVLAAPGPDEIAAFGALAMGRDGTLAQAYFEKLRADGHSFEWLCTHLLAPTARHLGGLWEQDLCDFVDVTLGLGRLQEILARFGAPAETRVLDERHCALLISTPGEKHLFGLEIVAESLRGAGWRVRVERGFDAVRSAAAVAAEWVGVVGVTLSGETGLESAARIIESVRRASLNPRVGVIVGGPAFANSPPRVAQVGADAVAADGPAAVIVARQLLAGQRGGR